MPLTGDYAPSTRDWVREQAERYELSNGAEADTLLGKPIILMTCLGAATGKLRKVPLMRVEHEGEYAAVASYGGRPEHPAWHHNLKRNPRVLVQDRTVRREYLAREVSGEERSRWWERAVAAYPEYADYQTKTTREIPIFVLTPADESSA
jgi:F420H(2)-dependent quinone reductase